MLTTDIEISRTLVALWALPALGAIVVLFLGRAAGQAWWKRARGAVRLLVVIYFVGVLIITLYPLRVDVSLLKIEGGNWQPLNGALGFLFGTEAQVRFGARDVLANIVLSAPLGLLLPFAIESKVSGILTVIALSALALGLEVAQGLISQRTFDIDDAISCALGAVVGVVGAVVMRPFLEPKR